MRTYRILAVAVLFAAIVAGQADATQPKPQKNATRDGARQKISGVVTSDSKGKGVLEDCDGKTAYDFSGLDTSEASPTVGDYYSVDAYVKPGGSYKNKTTYKISSVEDFQKLPKPADCKAK